MVILITGGTAGIGAAIAQELNQEGHRVFAAGRRVTNHFVSNRISTLQMDVTNSQSVQTAVQLLHKQTGKIDVLIQCAGRGAIGPLEAYTAEEIAEVFDLNLLGIFRVNQAVLPLMRKRKEGKIILISSLAAEAGLPFQSVYCASKAALDSMTEALRMEIKDFGVQVCVVQPGDFKTEVGLSRKLPTLAKDSPYHEVFKRINENVTRNVEQADDPVKVAKKISRLVKKKKLRLKYRVATPIEKMLPTAKKILPSSWFESLLMKYYGL